MGPKFPGIDFDAKCPKPCGYCGLYTHQPKNVLATGTGNILAELGSGRYSGFYLSPNTDAFGPATRGLSHELLANALPLGLVILMNTKQVIPTRTIDLLSEYRHQVIVQISVPTLDEGLVRVFEPGAATIYNRLRTIEHLSTRGIAVTVLIMPWLDVENDTTKLPKAIATAGATRAIASLGVFTDETIESMRSSGHPSLITAARRMIEKLRVLIGEGNTFVRPERVAAYLRLMKACKSTGLKPRVCAVALNPDLADNKDGIPMCTQLRHQKLTIS